MLLLTVELVSRGGTAWIVVEDTFPLTLLTTILLILYSTLRCFCVPAIILQQYCYTAMLCYDDSDPSDTGAQIPQR